jgi:DNA polymerase III subunit delta'
MRFIAGFKRRWRISLTSVLGQEQVVSQLERASRSGRLAHAYLFWGPEGVGKTRLALALIQGLACQNKGIHACGKCPACHKTRSGNHPDLCVVEPEKAEGQIGIKSVRQAVRRMGMKPYIGPYKIIFLKRADLLTIEAANALLKSLEEPDPEMFWVLTARHLSRIPLTLLSRVQLMRVEALGEGEAVEYLRKQGLPQEEALLLARLSEGSLGRANRFLEEEGIETKNQWINRFLLSRDPSSSTAPGETWKALGDLELHELVRAFDLFTQWFRDLLLISENVSEIGVIHADRLADLKTEAPRYTQEQLISLIEVLTYAKEMLGRNVNKKILVGWIENKMKRILCETTSI